MTRQANRSQGPHSVVFRGQAPNTGAEGGDMVSTWVTNPLVHAEVQITS